MADEAFQAEYLPVGGVCLKSSGVLLVVARLAIPFHIERVAIASMMVALESGLRERLPTALTPRRLLDESTCDRLL